LYFGNGINVFTFGFGKEKGSEGRGERPAGLYAKFSEKPDVDCLSTATVIKY
jgi:hypothetical protein